MNPELRAAAEKLAKPCFHLVEAQPDDPVVGYWGGRRSDVPEIFPPEATKFVERRHVLSVDHALFAELGLTLRSPFALTIWTTDEGDGRPIAQHLAHGGLNGVKFEGGIPLTARAARSFPPFQAVCLYGDERVARWLEGLKLERWQYDELGTGPQELENVWREHCPLFADPPIVAQLGGWHVTWPEDNFYLPREMQLLVWTIRDAEPWYEVFLSSQFNLVEKARIT